MATTGSATIDFLLGLSSLPANDPNTPANEAITDAMDLAGGLAADVYSSAIMGIGLAEKAASTMSADEFARTYGPLVENATSVGAALTALSAMGHAVQGDTDEALKAWSGGAAALLAGDGAVALIAGLFPAAPAALGIGAAILAGLLASTAITMLWEKLPKDVLPDFQQYLPNPFTYYDPLVFDLDGNGAQTVSVNQSNVFFDYAGSGFASRTGWASSGDGVLFMSQDGQSNAVTRSNLIGAQSGDALADLRALDTNGDGMIDERDSGFNNLRVWKDSNGDGLFQSTEAYSLAELGIAKILLNFEPTEINQNGNLNRGSIQFVRTDGSVGQASEFNFATDSILSRFTVPTDFAFTGTALKLPELLGYGLVPDLRVAMSLNDDLAQEVKDFVLNATTMTGVEFNAAFEKLFLSWAGLPEGVDPNDFETVVKVVSAFYGQPNQDPAYLQGKPRMEDNIRAEYKTILSYFELRFSTQVIQAAVANGGDMGLFDTALGQLESLTFDLVGDKVSGDFSKTIDAMISASGGFGDFVANIAPIIKLFAPDFFGNNISSLISSLGESNAFESFNAGQQQAILDVVLADYSIVGTPASESLVATSGADLIYAGRGDDSITGGGDSDIYLYKRGDGNDTITEGTNGGRADQLLLADVLPSDVSLIRDGINLKLVIKASATGANDAGSVVLMADLDDYYYQGVEKITFADGTSWTQAQLRGMLLANTSADQTFSGFSGSDSYHYARGDGNDTIIEPTNAGGDDQLILDGINPSDVVLHNSGGDLTIVVSESSPGAGDGGSIILKATLDNYYYQGVEKIVFADGTVWDRATYVSKVLSTAGTNGDDAISGSNSDDVIEGGKGNDTIDGGGGNDLYVYARGDGNDTINEGTNHGTNDRLYLSDLTQSDVSFTYSGSDLTVHVKESGPGAGDAGSVVLKSSLIDYYDQGIEAITFADGSTLTRAQIKDLLLSSTSADETFTGFSGDDTYRYARGDGNDTIVEGTNSGYADQLLLVDIAPSEVSIQQNNGNVTIIIHESSPGAGDGGSITMQNSLTDYYGQGVETVAFDDGTVWTRADMQQLLFTSTSADETFNGIGGDTTYRYARGDGNDTIYEGTNAGSNDRLLLTNINPSEVRLANVNGDILVTVNESAPGAGDGGSINLKYSMNDYYSQGVELLQFADGTVWTRDDMRAEILKDAANGWYPGTAGNDSLSLPTNGATVVAGKGDDTLSVQGNGGDTIVFSKGDGHDIITNPGSGYDRTDVLKLTDITSSEVTLTRQGDALIVSVPSTGDRITVSYQYWGDSHDGHNYGIGSIVFADGTVWDRDKLRSEAWYRGTAGNDSISLPTNGATVVAGKGDDTLSVKGNGGDTIVFSKGDGHDIITNPGSGYDRTDVLKLTDITSSEVTLTRQGDALIVSVPSTGDRITVSYQYWGDSHDGHNYGIGSIVFADGTTLNRDDILTRIQADAANAGNSSLSGSARAAFQIIALSGLSGARDMGVANASANSLTIDDFEHMDLRPFVLEAPAESAQPTIDWSGGAWGAAGDGILAIDLGADGQAGADGTIDQAKEVSFSLWASAPEDGSAASNMDGLRQAFDSNGDGILDDNDDRWSEFRLWSDANQNGITDPGELESLSDDGIKLINLMPAVTSQSFAEGSAVAGTATYGTLDGSSYLAVDTSQWAKPSAQQAA